MKPIYKWMAIAAGALLLASKKKPKSVKQATQSVSDAALQVSKKHGLASLSPNGQILAMRRLLNGEPTVGVVQLMDLGLKHPTPAQISVLYAIDPTLEIVDPKIGTASIADLYALAILDNPGLIVQYVQISPQQKIQNIISLVPEWMARDYAFRLAELATPAVKKSHQAAWLSRIRDMERGLYLGSFDGRKATKAQLAMMKSLQKGGDLLSETMKSIRSSDQFLADLLDALGTVVYAATEPDHYVLKQKPSKHYVTRVFNEYEKYATAQGQKQYKTTISEEELAKINAYEALLQKMEEDMDADFPEMPAEVEKMDAYVRKAAGEDMEQSLKQIMRKRK